MNSLKEPSGASEGMPLEGPTQRPGRKANGSCRGGGAADCVGILTKPGARVGLATRPEAVYAWERRGRGGARSRERGGRGGCALPQACQT